MEVVMGLKPTLPGTLMSGLPIEDKAVPDYTKALLDYLKMTHKEVLELARQSATEHEGHDVGRAEGLAVGDLVAMRRTGEDKPGGRTRFVSRVRDEIYVVSHVLGKNTYSLRTLLGNKDPLISYGTNKYHGDLLVKLNMPILEDIAVGRLLRYTTNGDDWFEARVRAVALDGRVYLERTDNVACRVWADLTRMRYKWVT